MYEPIRQTAGSSNSAGRVYYKGMFTDTYLFYDPDCDGTGTASPIWMLSATAPDYTLSADLDGDGAAPMDTYSSSVAFVESTSSTPPSDVAWSMACSSYDALTSSYTDVRARLRDRAAARLPHAGGHVEA